MTTTPEPAATHDPTKVVAGDLVADAAEAIREKLDQWLDRVVDRILATPPPGTAAWQQAWRNRTTPTGRAAQRQRLLTRIAVAHRAGIDPTPDIHRALAAGIPARDLPTTRRAHPTATGEPHTATTTPNTRSSDPRPDCPSAFPSETRATAPRRGVVDSGAFVTTRAADPGLLS